MKKILQIMLCAAIVCGCNAQQSDSSAQTSTDSEAPSEETTLPTDTFTTEKGRSVAISFIKHVTLMINAGGYAIHIDPVGSYGTDYATLPKADLILVTHEPGDHYDADAIAKITKEGTLFLSNGTVAEMSKTSVAMKAGDTKQCAQGITVTAVPAHNISPDRLKFHPQGRDVGYVLEIDNLRIYIAGDTEDIPDLANLKGIDIAFLPVNQPYTMTPAQCINAIAMFSPKIVYPYHYGETDLTPIVNHFAGSKATEVRIRDLQ